MSCHIILRRMSSSVPKTESSSLNYCISLLQRRAYEQYLATLLLPPKLQRCGFAIRAFNVEISGIRDQISSRNTGLGRTVFWQDLIQKLYTKGNIPNHPVARELQYVIENVSVVQCDSNCLLFLKGFQISLMFFRQSCSKIFDYFIHFHILV